MEIKGKQEGASFVQLVLGPVFLLNAVLFFFQALTKNLYPPLLVPLREAFLIDNAQAGLLITLAFLGYAIARYPSGVIADQIGCTKTVLIGSAAMVLSFMGVAFSPSYPLLALTTFILGVSSGIYVTAGYTLAVIIGSRKRATTATAVFETFGILSSILAPAIVTLFIICFSWQLLFALCGLLLALATLLFYKKRRLSERFENAYARENGFDQEAMKQHEGETANPESKPNGLLQKMIASTAVFKDSTIRRFLIWSTLVGGLGALTLTGINSFIPTFLIEERFYSFDLANRMYMLIAVAGISTKIVIGWLADRFGSKRLMLINLTMLLFFYLALTVVKEHWQLVAVLMLIGAAALNANTLINAYVLRSMPPKYQGTGFGIFSTAYTVIYSFGPYFTGLLSVGLGLERAMQISLTGAFVAIIIILFSRHFALRPN